MVISTFVRLLTTFAVVTVIFLLIIQFQVFDEFSEVRNLSFGGECNPVTDQESRWESERAGTMTYTRPLLFPIPLI